MASIFDYILLRKKTDLGVGDTDYTTTQGAVPVSFLVTLPDSGGGDVARQQMVEILVEWRGAADVVVGGAGSFNAHVLRVLDRPAAEGGSVNVKSITLAGVAYQPMLLEDMRFGDQFGVALSAIAAPGTATQAWIYYKAVAE